MVGLRKIDDTPRVETARPTARTATVSFDSGTAPRIGADRGARSDFRDRVVRGEDSGRSYDAGRANDQHVAPGARGVGTGTGLGRAGAMYASSRPKVVQIDAEIRLEHTKNSARIVLRGDRDNKIDVHLDVNGGLAIDIDGRRVNISPQQARDLTIDAGRGNDSITVDANVPYDLKLRGGSGNDTIAGGAGNDQIDGGSGDDDLDGGAGDDRIWGRAGTDEINGGEGDDKIFGGDGDDLIHGGLGNDTIKGQRGDDMIFGDEGDDDLDGGKGDDLITGNGGNDTVRGGQGDDFISGDDGDDVLFGEEGKDEISGGAGNDMIEGNEGDDRLSGNEGDDQIFGGEGADRIHGGDGNDFIEGGLNIDTIDGGRGSDDLNHALNDVVAPDPADTHTIANPSMDSP